jgi:NAD(P)-dependent dehydrogenase (short-subunit alcohol dehydrogenase family)
VTESSAAIVTGGTRGVGAAISQALSEAGYLVVPVGRSAARYATDVSDPNSVMELRAAVEADVGRPGILVNAAGMFGPISLIADSDPRDWITTVMVDLVGAYLTCRAFVPGMIEAGWGRVINVSSAASLHQPGILNSAYGTSKAGLNQFTRHLAAELEGTGVTANVIHPGDLKTEMWGDIRDQVDRLGEIAAEYAQWVDWVEETGGDPVEKAAELVLRIVDSDVSGRFLWIDDPLQPAIASWAEDDQELPWSP